MSRYIDAEKLISDSGVAICNGCPDDENHFCEGCWVYNVLNAPTADAVEVERYGRWIHNRFCGWDCSECGKNPTKGMGYVQDTYELFSYCPNCGAKMDERKEK